ncbi:MAG: hypothetical protein AAFV80_21520, partial [Bacteroidota bacterium]
MKLTLVLVALVLTPFLSIGQRQYLPAFDISNEDAYSYYDYVSDMSNYMDTAKVPDLELLKNYGRWRSFWQTRVDDEGKLKTAQTYLNG